MNDQVDKANNLTSSNEIGTSFKPDLMDDPAYYKRLKNLQIKTPDVHTEKHSMIVHVSFSTLLIYIDELWKTFVEIGGEAFKKIDSTSNKDIFKKVMLILAEVKVCCAQRTCHLEFNENLPQGRQYFHEEMKLLNNLAEQLPYPLAIYLDCLGYTMEGKLKVIPVLAEQRDIKIKLAGAISCAPRQLLPLLLSMRKGVPENGETHTLAEQLKEVLPAFRLQYWRGEPNKVALAADSSEFWLTKDGRISLSSSEIQTFREIVKCFDKKGFNVQTDLLNGQGRMSQTVQTPEWFIDRPFRYFCMADISEYDQKLGAFFGFSFTLGHKVQETRYIGNYKTAHWQGEIMPFMMLKSILDHQQVCASQEDLE